MSERAFGVVPRPFRFGVQLTEPTDLGGLRERARKAEDLGYSTVFVPDHFRPQLAPLPALAAIAAVTETVRLGTLVLSNDYRHPAVLAKEAATIDVLSGGRFELGVGAGWAEAEYARIGLPFDGPGTRIARLEESLQILRALFGDEPVSFAGEHYEIADLAGEPKPVQPGGPPLLVGGGGKRVLSLAARQADIVGINLDLRTGVNLNPATREFGAAAGTAASAAATRERVGWVREAAGDRFDRLELNVRVYITEVTGARLRVTAELGRRLELPVEEVLQVPHVLVGTPEQIAGDLRQRREDYGLTYVVVGEGALEAFAPVIRELG